MRTRGIGRAAAVAVVLGLGAVAPRAHAASAPLLDTYYTVGSTGLLNSPPVPTFNLTTGGTVDVQLAPISIGAALQSLSFRIVDSLGHSVGDLTGSGTLSQSFDLAAGTYFALAYAQTTTPGSVGFLAVNVSFTPIASTVPIPAAGVLLASGLALLPFRRRRRESLPATA
jgi:hypothetical protein